MSETIRDALSRQGKYLVIGDMMIDRYIIGTVSRVSPEAPVPVLKVDEHRHNPGGAGNVAMNIAALNAAVTLLGFSGEDSAGRQLKAVMEKESIIFKPIYWKHSTITKTRLLASRQQIVRFDEENSQEPSREETEQVLSLLGGMDFSAFHGIVLSDYAKGMCAKDVCQTVISRGAACHIPVIVDPKSSNWEKFRGAMVITPNLKELSVALGTNVPNRNEDIRDAGNMLLRHYDLQNIIVTRSEQGMTLINNRSVEHFPTMARDIFDVSGAGDTVVACIARFLSAGLEIRDAIHIANLAAGVVVGHVGTSPISVDALLHTSEGIQGCLSLEYAKNSGKKIVFTNGCFDLLHPGHIDYLRKARQLGDHLFVGLNSDDSVRRLKGPSRPYTNQESRKTMLEALSFVDTVEIFSEDTPLELIRRVAPDILVKGGDYRIEDIVGREFARETRVIPFLPGYSTSTLIENIRHG